MCLSELERAAPPLDAERLKTVLVYLSYEPGVLEQFVRLARFPELWEYLRERGVTWDYVVSHYEPDLVDSVEVFAGFLAGAGLNVVETVKLPADLAEGLYVLTGSIWDRDLARRRDEFFGALKRLVEHPITTAQLAGSNWLHDFEDHAVALRWFQAGAMIGKVAPDLVAAVVAAPKAATAVGRALSTVPRLVVGQLRRLVPLPEVAAFLRGSRTRAVTSNGSILEKAGQSVVVRAQDGEVVGRIEPGDYTPEELAEWERELGRLLPDPQAPAAGSGTVAAASAELPSPVVAIDPEAVIRVAEEGFVRRKQVETIATPQRRGTVLHEEAAKYLEQLFPSTERVLVAVERRMAEIFDLPPSVANMTVADFLDAHPEVRAFTSVPSDKATLARRIGNLEPDLLVFDRLTGEAILWDLAPDVANPHFKKTLLYKAILERFVDVTSVRVAETYYNRAPTPRSAIPRR